MQTLDQCEMQLRAAAAARNFDDTRCAVLAYRTSFEQVWAALTPAERRASSLPAQAAEIMRWALGLTVAHRARLLQQRHELRAARRYLASGAETAACLWRRNG